MKSTVKKLFIATSIAAGMGGIFTAPAFAGNLTNATISGSAANDYYVYDSDATNTFITNKTEENVQKVLGGNITNPKGNVELAASSEDKNSFDFTKNTTLTGQIGGQNITLSSLTSNDWATTDASGMTFAQRWFNDALTANGFGSLLGGGFGEKLVYNKAFSKFTSGGGLQRFSDPNISYVNQDDSTGLISIGLAGHFDATNLLMKSLNSFEQGIVNKFRDPNKIGTPMQASEIVKVNYNGVTDYLYSFTATKSGFIEASDGKSHNGNYEVTLAGVPPTAVPEPSLMLGLLTVTGMFVSQRRVKKA